VVKTKFDSLLKLKKLKVDEINNELSKLNSKIEKANQELIQFQEEVSNFEYPKSGSFSLMNQFRTILNGKLVEVNQKRLEIDYLNNQHSTLIEKLKDVNLEFEKIKYLQAEEIKKEIQKLKKTEAKNLDEIALMLFKG
jgi:flagellar export protein FliJ